jgi:hypothetical protein
MRYTSTWLTLAVLILCLGGSLQAQDPDPAGQSVDPGDWIGDVTVVLDAIDSIHPAPYRLHPRQEFVAEAEALRRRLPELDYAHAVAGFARLVALLEDGHSRLAHVQLASHTHPELKLLPGPGFDAAYPVQFEIFADGLHVIRASEQHVGLLGGRVVAVNGKSPEEVRDALRPIVSHDNEPWLLYLLPEYLRSPGYLWVAGVLSRVDDSLRLTLADSAGLRTTVVLPAVAIAPGSRWIEVARHLGTIDTLPLYRRMTENYDFVYLAEPRAVYVRYTQVQDSPDESVAAFARRLFSFVDSAVVDRVVIDIRRNGGGDGYLNQPLVHGLIAADKLQDPGKVVVITDRGTFSAAIMFAADVEKNTFALFVGEPFGSPVNQYGDPALVTLPASGIQVKISSLYWQSSDPRDRRAAISPDVPAWLTFADYLRGRDPALEAALTVDPAGFHYHPHANENWARATQGEALPLPIQW